MCVMMRIIRNIRCNNEFLHSNLESLLPNLRNLSDDVFAQIFLFNVGQNYITVTRLGC